MPNWNNTTIKAKGIAKLDIFTVYKEEEGKQIDFNKIIPEPSSKTECPKDFRLINGRRPDGGDAHLQVDNDREWFNWYDWRCKFWGVKWNACDTYIEDDDTISFDTPWCAPLPVLLKLSEMLGDVEMEVNTYDGDDYHGVWHLSFKNGKCFKEEWEHDDYYDCDDDEEDGDNGDVSAIQSETQYEEISEANLPF